MTPRTSKLDLAEILRIEEQARQSWQESLKDIARGKILGFVAEIMPEEVPGYGLLPEREFKIKVLNQSHALFNAVKHRLVAAAEAAGDANWDQRVTINRKDSLVRVYRVMGEGTEPVAMPPAFAEKLLAMSVRAARGRSPNREVVEGTRRRAAAGMDGAGGDGNKRRRESTRAG